MTNEEIFEKNINIAYKIANKYLINYKDEIEDIRQIALIELWRCVQNWDHKHALTTYAYICIPGKINKYLVRKVIPAKTNNISISTPIYKDSEGNDLLIEDLVKNDIDYIDNIINNIDFNLAFKKTYFTDVEKKVIDIRSKRHNTNKMFRNIRTNSAKYI